MEANKKANTITLLVSTAAFVFRLINIVLL